ncbi:MAG TPA: ion transporter [Edaphocola sp.]|nr:ion transporter [Edaphocola sp.]
MKVLIPEEGWKRKVFNVIYRADSPAGRFFDISLLIAILLSTILVIWESVPVAILEYNAYFLISESILAFLFSVEYYLRIASIKNKKAYIFSTFGIIDFLSIISFFISLLFPQMHFLIALRLLRLLRIFRILRLIPYLEETIYILKALQNSYRKILIFLLFVFILSVIVGSVMYVIEGGREGFHNIPQSIYWAVVTITTVGYGDVAPITAGGKFISIILMLCGYGIIAVPTGIMVRETTRLRRTQKICKRCGCTDHDGDARYCKKCGERIIPELS